MLIGKFLSKRSLITLIIACTAIAACAHSYVLNDANLTSLNIKDGHQKSLINNQDKKAAATKSTTPTSNSVTESSGAAPVIADSNAKPVALGAAPVITQGISLYVDHNSSVSKAAVSWAASNPTDSRVMGRLSNVPMASWFGDFSGDIVAASSKYVNAATVANQMPVLVAYNIPNRDCGSYSSGGAQSPAAYKSWIDAFASGIGQRNAIVILEPDALAGIDCLSGDAQQTRYQLITYAVQTLRTNTKAAIYLDAGNANWQSSKTMASRLSAADIKDATGFSLNVSNYQTDAANITFGQAVSAAVGNKHFVIDTSRNGNGPGSPEDWCNSDGRAFGRTPTLSSGVSAVDAFLWIKSPGESDGQCGASQNYTSAPAAGAWWPQYALMLARNSSW